MNESKQQNSRNSEEKKQNDQQLSRDEMARELVEKRKPKEGSESISDAGKRRDDEKRYQ